MIQNLASLIDVFINTEKELLSKYHIVGHPTMIGDMYEELTKEVFEKTMIPHLDLRVVSGKVRLSDGTLSNQTDCMVVIGDGDQLPRTKNYIYDKANVIATIEVKKNLFTNEIGDAFGKLNSVKSEFPEDILAYENEMIYEAFCSILYGTNARMI